MNDFTGRAQYLLDRIKIDVDGHWIWQLALTKDGYGQGGYSSGNRNVHFKAHRLSYQTFVGPIPEGFEVDHVCRVRACINPDPSHLEAVPPRVNKQRTSGTTDLLCGKGHILAGHNRRVVIRKDRGGQESIRCRDCDRAAAYRWRDNSQRKSAK